MIAGSHIIVNDPKTGAEIGRVAMTSAAAVQEALQKARRAQPAWAALSVKARAQVVRAFADVLMSRIDEVATLISRENGKPKAEAMFHDITGTLFLAHHYARKAPCVLRPHTIGLGIFPHKKSQLHYLPRGVVGMIAPWNFPFSIPQTGIIMALLAGNAVLLKPSEWTPLIALRARELWSEAGLPADLLQVLPGDGAVGAAMIEAGVDFLQFTGSTATGRKVAAACAERLIPCTMELGGKAPAIIRADADIERTARALVWGAFANAGQVCASVERVYVNRAIAEPLIARIVTLTKALQVGGDESEISAMTMPAQLEKVQKIVSEACAQGAVCLTGGQALPADQGRFFTPTVLTGVTDTMRIMRDEIFGPVMPIQIVDSDEEALSKANNSQLGLLAYVFSANVKQAQAIARQVKAGTVMINDVLYTYNLPQTPWRGIGDSGWGVSHSDEGLKEMCIVRHINAPRFALFTRERWWFPYRLSTYELGKNLLQTLYGRGFTRMKSAWKVLGGFVKDQQQ